jgi:DNA repair photolyase
VPKTPDTPATPPDRFYDSSMGGLPPVEQTSSWLSINPIRGCPLGCTYCFRLRWDAAIRPTRHYDLNTSIAALLEHPKFVPHKTPITINISSTDALLPRVKPTTFEAIKALDALQLRNPFGITTKLPFKRTDIETLTGLAFIRPIVFTSLAFLPWHVEPVPIEPRIESLKRLHAAGISSVLYFRPIIKDLNDSPMHIGRALDVGEAFCHAICIGGLRLSPEIANNMALPGLRSKSKDDFHDKRLPTYTEELVFRIHGEMKLTIPIYKHTSCAVSLLTKQANYNSLYHDAQRNCTATCPREQRDRCYAR